MKTLSLTLLLVCCLPLLVKAATFKSKEEEIVEFVISDIEDDADAVTVAENVSTSASIPYDNVTYQYNMTTNTPLLTTTKPNKSIQVASINWEEVKSYLITTIFFIVTCVAKLGYHKIEILGRFIPESCILVVIGVIAGGIMFGCHMTPDSYQLSSNLFFYILLPPIVLDSAYSLHDRVFFHNIGTVLLMAVIGTIANTFILGLIDWGLALGGAMGNVDNITLTQCLVFSALIAAVDPVAVLAIFQEIHVNNALYYLVFGESLLNDAVTVVLYNTMIEYNAMTYVSPKQVGLGFATFFAVSLGGLGIGVFVGIVTCLFTRFTNDVALMEPLVMFITAYCSYLLADLFELSGIISCIGCGLVQAHYAFNNVTEESRTIIIGFAHTLSTTSDCIIFLFLGLSLVSDHHHWNTGFALWNVLLCLVVRFIIVYVLTIFANLFRVRKISKEEQFIMAYGGLRGAVAFSLTVMLDENEVPKNMFMTTTLLIILCTVFIQGITIKPLVKLFRITRSVVKVDSMVEEVNEHLTDFLMVSMENIIGSKGQNQFREWLIYYDETYLKKWLQNNPHTKNTSIVEMHRSVSVSDYINQLSASGSMEKLTTSASNQSMDTITSF